MQSIPSWLSSFSNYQPTVPEQLQSALYTNSASQAIEILENDPSLIGQSLPNGELPLNYAIRFGRQEVVDHILKASSAILESSDCHGLTPVDHAILSKDHTMIELALARKLGISPSDIRLKAQVTLIESLLNSRNIKTATSFAEKVAKQSTPPSPLSGLFEAAAKGNLELIRESIQTTADANTTTTDGWSLLHLAVFSGNADMVLFLLKKGANPNLMTLEQKLSPLHIAALGHSRHVLRHLLDNGADLAAVNKEGSTAALFAATKQELFSLQYLMERGADALIENHSEDYSPLQLVVTLACASAVKKDPLKVDTLSHLLFWGTIVSIITSVIESNGIINENVAFHISETTYMSWIWIASHIMAFQSAKSLPGKISYISTALLSYVPGINILNQAWKSYSIAQTALAGLKNCWSYRHIETARPLKIAAVHLTNSLYAGKGLVDSTTWAYTKTMEIANLFSRTHEYFMERPWESACQDFPSMSKDRLECFKKHISDEFDRFQSEGWFTLQNKVDPLICKDKDLKKCIDQYNLQPLRLSHARAILGLSEKTPSPKCRDAYRNLVRKFHPDRCKEKHCSSLTQTIKIARQTICP